MNNKFTKKSFVQNSAYIFYKIGERMYNEGINSFDDISIESYLIDHSVSKEHYENAGGNKILRNIREIYDGTTSYSFHLDAVLKFSALRELEERGLINCENESLVEKLSDPKLDLAKSKKLLLYNFDEAYANVDYGDVEIVDLTPELMSETLSDVRDGYSIGMDLYNAPMLTRMIKGFARGRLTFLGMKSGVGKSTMLRNMYLQSIIDSGEKCIVLINEESLRDWIANIVISIMNSRVAPEEEKMILKETVFSGGFDQNVQSDLDKAVEWYKNNFNGNIKLAILKKYRFKDVSKILTKYAKIGYNYVLFDTFKPDGEGTKDRQRWEQFSLMSRELYDLVKPENLNLGVLATVQLGISDKAKYLTLANIGKSKEIVEVADIVLLGRKLFKDEYPDGDDIGENTLIIKDSKNRDVELDIDKDYIILYFGKNRVGSINEQIVLEMDYAHNILKEVGICTLREEF